MGPLQRKELHSGLAWDIEPFSLPRSRSSCHMCACSSCDTVTSHKGTFPTNKVQNLVGEQSNAYRILLRYDRKSRHRRIKKQRRYERLAATSQFRYTGRLLDRRRPSHFSAPCGPVDGCTLSGGRSPYLRYTDSQVRDPHLGER